MLNGLDPVLIFQFSKLAPVAGATVAKIPVISSIPTVIDQPPIPIYLSEQATGIMIDVEDKNVDIETDTETKTDGSDPDVNQKGIANVVSVQLTAKKDSIGMTLLSSLIDYVYDKSTSKEYAITYLHGAITVFRGVLHSFSINQTADNDLLSVKIEISKGTKNPTKQPSTITVPGQVGPIPIGGA